MEPASPELRAVCIETFDARKKQKWPPDIAAHESWLAPMERLAEEMGLDTTSAALIVERVRLFVQAIAAAR